jgi:predicted murein hydrolase (TIGR00659 family)
MSVRAAVLESPIFGVGITVGWFVIASLLYRRLGRHPLLTPVFVTIVAVAATIKLLGIDYRAYAASATPISLLLGPATVALALPLVRAARSIREAALPVLLSVVCGCLVAISSAWAMGAWLGAGDDVVRSLLTRSVTTPVAIGVAEQIGGVPALAAVFAVTSGVIGAMAGPWLLDLFRIRDPRARGLAIGVSSHGIGTARALQESVRTGGWSSAGMVLNALLTTAVLPILTRISDG